MVDIIHPDERTWAHPRQRVLVVDDHLDSARSLAQVLSLDGFEVCVAMDTPQALTEVASFAPTVVLLDIGLPGLTGYDAAERIRLMPGGHAIKLIAITGWCGQGDRRRAESAGFDHHLTKPVDLKALRRLIDA